MDEYYLLTCGHKFSKRDSAKLGQNQYFIQFEVSVRDRWIFLLYYYGATLTKGL